MKKSEKAIWNKLKNQYADDAEVLDLLCKGENAAEKQSSKKCEYEHGYYPCPSCGSSLVEEAGEYCPDCGQRYTK